MIDLANLVSEAKDPLVSLWITTVKNSRYGASKEGLLTQRWMLEEKEAGLRLSKIKERGVDAKFGDLRVSKVKSNPLQFKKVQREIESKLQFPMHNRNASL
jgi:hypothetical protein